MKNYFCNDVDGNILFPSDKVVVLDVSELEGDTPKRGDVLKVNICISAENNYIEFIDEFNKKYAFYGHRVLILNN